MARNFDYETKSRATVSFTAPQITEEQWRQERAEMSPDALHELKADMDGTGPVLRETDDVVGALLEHLQMALQLLPAKQKECYMEAKERCPELVQLESRPIQFLRSERYDAEAAAKRMASYWEMRVNLFGSERAFRPMVMLANGKTEGSALTAEDVTAIRGGGVQILPQDVMGRNVIYLRRSEFTHKNQRSYAMPKVLFYVLHAAFDGDLDTRHGCVLLYDCKDLEAERFDRKMVNIFYKIIRDCIPMHVSSIHVCYPALRCVARFFLPTVLWMMGRDLRQRATVHAGTQGELSMDLKFCGICRENAPQALGGDFSQASFEKWIEGQRKIESAKWLGLQGCDFME